MINITFTQPKFESKAIEEVVFGTVILFNKRWYIMCDSSDIPNMQEDDCVREHIFAMSLPEGILTQFKWGTEVVLYPYDIILPNATLCINGANPNG
jgi:hypothetical protein